MNIEMLWLLRAHSSGESSTDLDCIPNDSGIAVVVLVTALNITAGSELHFWKLHIEAEVGEAR